MRALILLLMFSGCTPKEFTIDLGKKYCSCKKGLVLIEYYSNWAKIICGDGGVINTNYETEYYGKVCK
jgi:hypothetical protein